jgi:hypothetical protein
MDINNSKIRMLSLTTVISKCEKGALLKYIQSEDGVINCFIQGSCLSLEYDLMQISLEELLPEIKQILETSGIKLKENFVTKLKSEFIFFSEKNQRDNINNPSGWYLRLQNIYLGMAEHTQNNHDVKPSD